MSKGIKNENNKQQQQPQPQRILPVGHYRPPSSSQYNPFRSEKNHKLLALDVNERMTKNGAGPTSAAPLERSERTANMNNFCFNSKVNGLDRLRAASGSLSPGTKSIAELPNRAFMFPMQMNAVAEEHRASVSTEESQGLEGDSTSLNPSESTNTDRDYSSIALNRSHLSDAPDDHFSRSGPNDRSSRQAPSSEVVPFLYQDFNDVKRLGEAPVRQRTLDGSDQYTYSSFSSQHYQEKDWHHLAASYRSRMENQSVEGDHRTRSVLRRFKLHHSKSETEHSSHDPAITTSFTPSGSPGLRYSKGSSDHSPLFSRMKSLHHMRNSSHQAPSPTRSESKSKETDGLYFRLDTNVDDMNGIIAPPKKNDGKDSVQVFSRKHAGAEKSTWAPPDSWAVKAKAEKILDQADDVSLKESLMRNASNENAELFTQKYEIRVYLENNTFLTLLCPFMTTVEDLLRLISEKPIKNDSPQYQIVLWRFKTSKVLGLGDRPLVIQNQLLKQIGYTDADRFQDLCEQDNRYLFRVIHVPTNVQNYSREEDATLAMAGRFAHVDLQGRNLQTIPISLYQHASEIVTLNVSKNQSLHIPSDFIQSCTQLRDLRFCGNEAEKIPSCIKHALKLAYLDLSGNLMHEIDQSLIENLQSLVSLKIRNNGLAQLPMNFGKLHNLRSLNLASNRFTIFPLLICELISLVDLDVSFNKITSIPSEMGKLCALERFLASNNELSGQFPSSFNNLSNLKELDLNYNNIMSLDFLERLPKLEVLSITNNKVVSYKHNLSRLQSLKVIKNPLVEFSMTAVSKSLTVLELSWTNLTSIRDKFFENIPNLIKLILDHNSLTFLPSQIKSLSSLQYLSCVDNSLISLPTEIGELSELKHLDLHHNNLKSLPSEIWHLSRLVLLNISSNSLGSLPEINYHVATIMSAGSSMKSVKQDDSIISEDYAYKQKKISEGGLLSPNYVASSELHNKELLNGVPLERTDSKISMRSTQDGNSRKVAKNMSASLRYLYAADNSLEIDCFAEISILTELLVLNLSYNNINDIPTRAVARLTQLKELYLSGNDLSTLPEEDLENIRNLEILHINSNKFQTLPKDLEKFNRLLVLDAGSNLLRYNIANTEYDWNWNSNLNLRYLNFSGNKRFEIKPQFKRDSKVNSNEIDEIDAALKVASSNLSSFSSSQSNDGLGNLQDKYSDLTVLSKMKVLGMVDVTWNSHLIPDQTENRRIRTIPSIIHSMRYGIADTLGYHENLSTIDMVVERFRGSDVECIFGLFDGSPQQTQGNKIAKFLQENFASYLKHELEKLQSKSTEDKERRPSTQAELTDSAGTKRPSSDEEEDRPLTALRKTFLNLNRELGNMGMLSAEDNDGRKFSKRKKALITTIGPEDLQQGCAATVAYVQGTNLYLSFVGDATAVLVKTSGEFAQFSDIKHDPLQEPELSRVRNTGGWISRNGKIGNQLIVSRSFGYFDMLPTVTACPTIAKIKITPQDDFIVIASREVWDYLTEKMAVDIALSERDDLMRAAQKIRDIAISFGAVSKIMVMVIGIGILCETNHQSGILQFGLEAELSFLKKRRAAKDLTDDAAILKVQEEIPAPVGQIALVFTDIKDSTPLWLRQEAAMTSALHAHLDILRRELRNNGGYEVKTDGDGFIASFSTATSALNFCLGSQAQLYAFDGWAPELLAWKANRDANSADKDIFKGLSVRMGIHWGSPLCLIDNVTKRMDYLGPAVNLAARVSHEATGGQISLSADWMTAYKKIQNAVKRFASNNMADATHEEQLALKNMQKELNLLEEYTFEIEEFGERMLKGIENPEMLHVINAESYLGGGESSNIEAASIQGAITPNSLIKRGNLSVSTPAGLQMKQLLALNDCVLQLEGLCFVMAFSEGSTTKLGLKKVVDRLKGGIRLSVKPSDMLPLLELLIARLENCISTLFLRANGDFPISNSLIRQ